MSYTWVEPFAGAAAVALRLVGGRDLVPPVAWMGGKRRYARAIADAMGVPEGRPSRVVLGDAGPWGWVWPLLINEADKVAAVLRSWQGEHPRDLWKRLASVEPMANVYERAAQWLWLQARSASGVPIWWDGWRLTGSDGKPRSTWDRWGSANTERGSWSQSDHNTGRAQGASQTGGGEWLASDGRGVPRPAGQKALGEWRMGEEVKKSKSGDRTVSQKGTARGRTGGMVNPETISERIEAIDLAFAQVEVDVHHGYAAWVPPEESFCYLDPPYVGATGYGWDSPRAEVLEIAERWAAAGAVVAISEAVPIELDGWHHLELTRPGGKPEWLTLSREPVRLPEKQQELWEVA